MTTPAYTPEQQRSGQRLMILEGLFSRAMESVTTGIILTGFALALGASDAEIGLIAAIPFLAHLVHLPGVVLLARTRDRRAVAVTAAVAARATLLLIALIPFAMGGLELRPLHALIPLLVVYSVFANVGGAAWQVWVRDLVPREELGRYFGRRMAVLATVGVVVTLAAGQFVSWWRRAFPERELEAFGILFLVGGLAGFVSAAIVRRAPVALATPTQVHIRSMLRRPISDTNYRRVVIFLASWGFAANFSLPFVAVVLLGPLGYSVGTVVAFSAFSTAVNVLSLKVWAPVTDRFGNKPVLAMGASVFVLAIATWAFTPKETGWLVLASATTTYGLLGLGAGAIDLASNGLILKLAPDEDAPAYLATASVARSVAAGVAPLLAGAAATLLAGRAFVVRFAWVDPAGERGITALQFVHYDFLFLTSIALGLYAVHRLLGFEEHGEASPGVVVRSLRHDVGQFGGLAGLRGFAHLASYIVEGAYGLQRTMDPRRVRDAFDLDDDEHGPRRPPP
ncbi:MAG TPA: MFS transporter [Candidatus Thermoplasmatota archaeon]|nr:MFS transporter [Candidatus Thermoplasmatota archaeon]